MSDEVLMNIWAVQCQNCGNTYDIALPKDHPKPSECDDCPERRNRNLEVVLIGTATQFTLPEYLK